MANSYFQFKQFIVHQERCAMKVTTDGCLFGAFAAVWLLSQLNNKVFTGNNFSALDIGSGTGLLSLMMAQKNDHVIIDAIEIDEHAANQSKENFNASPWKKKLNSIATSIQDFVLSTTKKYDLIISNPPFYEQQLKGDNLFKNTAHHSAELTLNELFIAVNKLIKSNGYFIVLLPFYRTDEASIIASNHQLFLQEKILIKQTPKHNYFRSILVFSLTENNNLQEQTFAIKNEENEYTQMFQQLLKDYYLKF